jgi:hypothetical protein
MSDFELVVGAKVPVKTNKEGYRLIVNVMHGDGDKHEDMEMTFGQNGMSRGGRKLTDCLKFFRAYGEIGWNTRCDTDTCLLKRVAIECGLDTEIVDSIYDGFFPGDVTNNGSSLAMPVKLTVVYYDEDGVKYNVDVMEDGKIVQFNFG